MRVEGGDQANLDAYIRETSLSQFCDLWGRDARQKPHGLNGSATLEPMRQVLTYRLTAFSTNILAKSFALCLTCTCSDLSRSSQLPAAVLTGCR